MLDDDLAGGCGICIDAPNSGGGGDENDDDEGDLQRDMTEWLQHELNKELEYINLYEFSCYGGLECPFYRIGELYGSHLTLFGNGGRYDIKRKMESLGYVSLCGSQGCQWVDYSAPGNVMFGYLSNARGVSQTVSWVAGGALESLDNGYINVIYSASLYDNPGDKSAVDFGYKLYSKYPTGFTLQQFQNELTPFTLSTFQPPAEYPIHNGMSLVPMPQPNMYPPGHFLNP